MKFKVILFCALLFGSKFVAPIPFDEELGQQRAFQSNSWQGNQNTAEQYHGSDFARAHNVNTMTNSAQQYSAGQEYKANRVRHHSENYDFNSHSPSLHPLPARNKPVNFASGTNERRPDGFVSRGNLYPVRNQHQTIRGDNQFKQQNWQTHNRFENSAASAVVNTAAIHERTLTVQKPYYNSGQPVPLAPVNRQHYQNENLYPITEDVHYHPVPQETGNIRYVAHSGSNSETHTGPLHYENYHDVHAHNTNVAKSGNNANSQKIENYNRPYSQKTLNGPGSYIVSPESSNNHNIHVPPVSTGLNNFNDRINENPIIPSIQNNPDTGSGHNGQPVNTYRYMENPTIISGPNHHVHESYNVPLVPVDTILDEAESTRYVPKPVINSGPNNLAPPIIQPDAAPSLTPSNDGILSILTNDDQTVDIAADGKKPDNFFNLPQDNPNQNVYHFPDGENAKEYFLNKMKKKFVIIYANGTVEYVNHLNTGNGPNSNVVKYDKSTPPPPQPSFSAAPDAFSDKADHYKAPVTPKEYDYNNYHYNSNDARSSPQPQNYNDDYNSSPIPKSQQNEDTTSPPYLASTVVDYNPHYGPLKHRGNYNRHSEPRDNKQRRNNSNKENSRDTGSPSKFPKHVSSTGTHVSTTGPPDDAMLQEFLDSLSNKSDKSESSSDTHNYSSRDKISPDDNRYHHHPFNQTHGTTPSSKLHTVISPGIFRSTTPAPDDSLIEKYLDSLISESSPIVLSNGYDESLQDYRATTPLTTDIDNNPKTTPVDQIITISPIELITDNVRDGSTPNPVDEGTLDKDSVDIVKYSSNLDEILESNSTTTSDVSNSDKSHGADNDDIINNVLKTKNEKSDNKSACNDSLTNPDDPAKLDDNTAAPTNQNGGNTGDSATGDNSLESKPPTSGLEIKLNIPNAPDGTLYIKVDAPDDYTGNDDTSNDETLVVTITKQNSSDTDSTTGSKDTKNHDYLNNAKTNSDETNFNNNFKLDLSNAMVVMNGTNDKEYLSQLLSGDSKISLYVFMPCQDQAIVEKSKETTIYSNGTCVEQMTETRWKNKDDPSPIIITTKKIYADGNCH